MLGLGALYFFLIFFNIAGEFLVNTAGFVIPAYYSLEALFTSKSSDDTQWLTVSIFPCRSLDEGGVGRCASAWAMADMV